MVAYGLIPCICKLANQGVFVPEQLLLHTTLEFYDLQSDPPEPLNLAGKPQSNDLQRDPVIQLVTWIQETNDPLLKWVVFEPYYNKSTETLDALCPVRAYYKVAVRQTHYFRWYK